MPRQRKYILLKMIVYSLSVLTGISLFAGTGNAGNDLLRLPAATDVNATGAMLLGVVNTGERLVAVGERGIVIYSDDNGGSWEQAGVPVSVTLTAVCFPTPAKGWAVGHDGVVLHTVDGGAFWKKQLDGDKINRRMLVQVNKLMADRATGLKQADAATRDRLSRAYEDLQFFKKDIELSVSEGPTRPLLDVWFKNEHEGLVVGAFGMILRTADGGGTWEPVLDRIENPEGLHYYGIAGAGGSIFIAGEMGTLYRSDDGGNTWKSLASPYNGSFFGIVANPGGDAVIAFGLRGNAFRSTDNGTVWTLLDIPRGASLAGAAILSDGSVALVGQSGDLMLSSDRGKTFTVIETDCRDCAGVVQSRAGHVVMVGLRGVIRANL